MIRSDFYPIILSLLSTVLLTYGCASIIHGSRQELAISSEPIGARVLVNGEHVGETPWIANLERKKKEQTIRIELEGYQPFELKLERKISGWYWGNLIFGGIIGLILDPINGSMYKLTPPQIEAVLNIPMSKIERDAIYIAVSLTPDPRWEQIGVLKLGLQRAGETSK